MVSYFIGDVHLRFEEPFCSVTSDFLDYLTDLAEEGSALIFTGDFFHRSRPYPEESKIARKFFENCKNHGLTVYVLAGNHEYLRERGTWAEDAFKEYDVRFITEPDVMDINGMHVLFLPWIPYSKVNRLGKNSLKDYYADFLSKFDYSAYSKDDTLFVVYHFEDESIFMGNEVGVDLSVIESNFKGKVVRIGGHIHNPSRYYIGAPYATRSDETDKERHIIKVDDGTVLYNRLPNWIRFCTLMYPEIKTYNFDPNIQYMLKVLDVPSYEAVKELISEKTNVWLDDYELKFGEKREVSEHRSDLNNSIQDFLRDYIRQNKVDPDTANYLLSVF